MSILLTYISFPPLHLIDMLIMLAINKVTSERHEWVEIKLIITVNKSEIVRN